MRGRYDRSNLVFNVKTEIASPPVADRNDANFRIGSGYSKSSFYFLCFSVEEKCYESCYKSTNTNHH